MLKRSMQVSLAALALACGFARAEELPPTMGQNMPLYPGLYFTGAIAQDARDSAYDQSGNRQDTVAPAAGGRSSFPGRTAIAAFTWHFPMLESYGLPYVSSHTHMARVTLRYGRLQTRGQLSAYVDSQSANDLQNSGDGFGDTTLEFGTFVYGSTDWRTRATTPVAVLATFGLDVPTGVYERNAPVNMGTNAWAYSARLGAHANLWSGGFIEGEAGLRRYARNEEPEFGGLAPHKQGADLFVDVSVTQKIWRDFFLGAFMTSRRGGTNEYKDPVVSPNPNNPSPPPNSDTYPTPGRYYDQGTSLNTMGLNASYFLTQRWMAALSFTRPISGKSGEFDLPFTARTPANCLGGANCTTMSNGSVHEDGYGPARAYASSTLMLSVTHNFGLSDTFACPGCER